MDGYYGNDGWDYDRRRASRNLDPRPGMNGGLYRTRSTGHTPTPVVNIYNDQVQESSMRGESPYRYPPPPPSYPMMQAMPQAIPVPYPVDMRGRSPPSRSHSRNRGMLGDELVEDLADMAIRDRFRSRSRGRSDFGYGDRAEFDQWRVAEQLRHLDEDKQRELWQREAEVRLMKEEQKKAAAADAAKADEKRFIAEYELKKQQDDEKAKAAEIRIKDKIERDAREAKEKEAALRAKIEREKVEEKEKKEKAKADFLREQREEEEKKKAKEKERKQEMETEMRRRLEQSGLSQETIDVMVDEEKMKRYKEDRSRSRGPPAALEPWRSRGPVYAKIHRDYLSVDTLRYYDIPYEYDRTNTEYIIIKREMDKYETEVLFEHTRRLRTGKLLVEAPKPKSDYAWYRKRDRSTSRVRKLGILEIKRT